MMHKKINAYPDIGKPIEKPARPDWFSLYWVRNFIKDFYPMHNFNEETISFLSQIPRDILPRLVDSTLSLFDFTYKQVGLYHLYCAVAFDENYTKAIAIPEDVPLWHSEVAKHAIHLTFDDNFLSSSDKGIITVFLMQELLGKKFTIETKYKARLSRLGEIGTIYCAQIKKFLPENFDTFDLIQAIKNVTQ